MHECVRKRVYVFVHGGLLYVGSDKGSNSSVLGRARTTSASHYERSTSEAGGRGDAIGRTISSQRLPT